MSIDVIEYLEDEVRKSIITDVVDVAAYHGRRQELDSGHYSTPRQVFCYVDHLGYVAYGDSSSTKRAVKFIKEFFPSQYEAFAELLFVMWRHGTVHQLKPYSYRAPLRDASGRQVAVRWLSTNHNRKQERTQHMLVFPMEDTPDTVFLVVNSCQLADDLLSAVNGLINHLRAKPLHKEVCEKRIESLTKICDYTETSKSMVPIIKSQIRDAWNRQGGRLNKNGTIVKPHPETKGK